jgi:hypothetical protein
MPLPLYDLSLALNDATNLVEVSIIPREEYTYHGNGRWMVTTPDGSYYVNGWDMDKPANDATTGGVSFYSWKEITQEQIDLCKAFHIANLEAKIRALESTIYGINQELDAWKVGHT